MIFFPLLVFLHSQVRVPGLCLFFYLLRSTKGDRNPNLQVAITHAKAFEPSSVIARFPQPSISTSSFSLPASLMVLFCLGSPHASRIGPVFEAIEGAVPQSAGATGSNFKQEMFIIFVGAQKRVARTQTNLKKTAICVQAKGSLRCHLSDALKQKMKVTRNL